MLKGKTYVYDKRADRIVEKRSRDGLVVVADRPDPMVAAYQKLMREISDILDRTC